LGRSGSTTLVVLVYGFFMYPGVVGGGCVEAEVLFAALGPPTVPHAAPDGWTGDARRRVRPR